MKRILILTCVCLLALVSAGCRTVTGGTYTLRSGETLSGDLSVTGGAATLQQGSRVTGSLFVTGGSVDANGQIDGDVTLTGGSVDFGPTAVVGGVLQKTGGGVSIAEGAHVQYAESPTTGSVGRSIGSLLMAVVLIPLLLIVAVIVLLTTRTSRGSVRQSAVASQSSVPSQNAVVPPAGDVGPGPAPAGVSSVAERGAGLSGSIVLAVILIGLGVLFLFQEFFNVNVWQYGWPLLIVGAGLVCFAGMALGGKSSGRLAIPGSLLTIIGLVLLYQNTFDQFQSWAYAWALVFPTAVGIGRYIEGWWSDRPDVRERGIRETRTGLILFVVLAAFFELVLNLGGFFGGDLIRFALPIFLISIGVLILLSRLLNWPAPKPATPMPPGTGTAVMPPPAESDRQPPAER